MFSADCFVTAMAAIVSPIGGVRLFPWIGVIVWLLLLQLAVADDDWKPTLLPVLTGLEFVDDTNAVRSKTTGLFYTMSCSITNEVVINSMVAYKDPTAVDDLIDGFLIMWPADKSGWPSLLHDEQIGGKLFKLFVNDVVQMQGAEAPPEARDSRLHWVEATAVVRKAYEKGLILPLGFIKTSRHGWGCVWPGFKGLSLYCGAGSAFNLNSWTADQVLKLANSVVASTTLLHQNGLSYGRLLTGQIFGDEENTKFLLNSFSGTKGYGEQKLVFGSVPGELYPKADSFLQLYEVGEMLATVPAGDEPLVQARYATHRWSDTLKRHFHKTLSSEDTLGMVQVADTFFGNDDSDDLTVPFNVFLKKYKNKFETVSLWLNIARFSRPYLFGEDLTFKRDSKEELGNDSASRLQTFCTLALVGVGEYRPTLEGAAKYLQDGTDVADLLKVDVPKYLIPYSLFLARQMEVEAPAHDSHKDCIFDKLSRVAKNLIEVGIRRNVGDDYKHTVERYTTAFDKLSRVAKNLIEVGIRRNVGDGYKQTVERYTTAIDKMKDGGATAITQSKNESLRVALNVVHTFCFMFPDFIKYLTVEGLKAAGFLEVDAGGKDEYWNIPEETRTLLNRCNNKVLEQLVGKV
eukprot:GHVS01060756.1.p1 GENE.GHVS01060756.1~~GHVS01060756.1.p1  ORF type:complete len:631 (+),score=72.68 GHVS01060756.1:121-2013(+)